MASKDKVWTSIKEYLVLTIGVLIYVTGWTVFLTPHNIVGGGVTGISSIIQYATGFPMGYTYFILNILLLVVAFIILGMGSGAKTIYAIALASIGLNVLQAIIPYEIIDILTIRNGKLMSTLMGGIMAGLGIGMAMSVGGSTGGTDIIALIINKYKNVSLGKLILVMDVVIILSSILVPSFDKDGNLIGWADKVTNVVYGLILVTINSNVVDLYISGAKQSVLLFIFSKKYDKIADAIAYDLKRGATVLDSMGWHSKQHSHVLMVITRKSDLNLLLRYIKSIDEDAFLSVGAVSGVYGKGFDTIKESLRHSLGNDPQVEDSGSPENT